MELLAGDRERRKVTATKMKQSCKEYLAEQIADETIAQGLYDKYAAYVVQKLEKARAKLSAGDWEELSATAHTIKGDAISLGDAETAIAAAELRAAAKNRDTAACSALLEKLRIETAAL